MILAFRDAVKIKTKKHKDHFRPLCSSLWQLRQGAELFVQLCINFKQIENVSGANLSINKITNTTGKNAKDVSSEQILYNHLSIARDVDTPELLKEMTTKRGLIEESLNKRSTIMESTAMELPGLTAQTQQDLKNLEEYLPLLACLLSSADSQPKTPKNNWMSDIKIQWSSAMTTSCYIKIGGPKFFRIDNLRFELGMSLFLYGAVLRERAFETLSIDLVESATLFRKAAGVYSYLAEKVLPPLKLSLPKESPVEATSSLSSIMKLVCLADAQAVTIRRAEEKGNSPMLLSKLHYGVTQMLDEASSILTEKPGELNDLSARIKEFISTCKVLYELRSQRYLAEEHRSMEKIGVAIVVLRHANANANKAKAPKNQSYVPVFTKEIKDASEMLRKFEHENDFVWHDKIPSANMLPPLQGTSIVSAIPYEPPKRE